MDEHSCVRNGKVYIAVPDTGCEGCDIFSDEGNCLGLNCSSITRKDRTSVVWKLQKEFKPKEPIFTTYMCEERGAFFFYFSEDEVVDSKPLPQPMESIRDLLPDVYGRKAHAKMLRYEEFCRYMLEHEALWDVRKRLDDILGQEAGEDEEED